MIVRLSSLKRSDTGREGLPCEGFASRYWMAWTFPSLVCGISCVCLKSLSGFLFNQCVILRWGTRIIQGEEQVKIIKLNTSLLLHYTPVYLAEQAARCLNGGIMEFWWSGAPDRPRSTFLPSSTCFSFR